MFTKILQIYYLFPKIAISNACTSDCGSKQSSFNLVGTAHKPILTCSTESWPIKSHEFLTVAIVVNLHSLEWETGLIPQLIYLKKPGFLLPNCRKNFHQINNRNKKKNNKFHVVCGESILHCSFQNKMKTACTPEENQLSNFNRINHE